MTEQLSLTELADSLDNLVEVSFRKDIIRLSSEYEVSVPPSLRDDSVITALIKYFNSGWFREKGFTTARLRDYHRALTYFFESINDIDYVPETIGSRWLKTIKAKSESEHQLRCWNLCITVVLDNISKFETKGIEFSSTEVRKCSSIRQIWPHIKWKRADSRKTLEALTPLEYSNAQLFRGLRGFTVWYVLSWSDIIRQAEEKLPHIADTVLSDLETYGRESYFHKYSRLVQKKSLVDREIALRGDFPPSQRIYTLLAWIEAANVIDSDLLKDLVYFAFRFARHKDDEDILVDPESFDRRFTRPISNEERDAYLASLHKTGSTGYSKLKWPTLPPITALFSPSYEMQICIAWLLASDRHTATGINLMTISSLQFTENSTSTSISVQSFKGRNKKTNANVEYEAKDIGENYKKNHPIFKALYAYRNDIVAAYDNGWLIRDDEATEKQLLLPFIPCQPDYPRKMKKIVGVYSDSDCGFNPSYAMVPTSPRYATFTALKAEGLPSSAYLRQTQSAPFLELLEYSMSHNHRTRPFTVQGADGKKKHIARTAPEISIAPSFISQTEPSQTEVSDYELIGHGSEPVQIDQNATAIEQALEAKRGNHTEETRENVYKARNVDRIRLDNQMRFAERVGEEMTAAAMSIFEIDSMSAKTMTITQLAEHLGFEKAKTADIISFNEIVKEAKIADYLVESSGVLSKDGEFIVVKTPITAALMSAYIKYLDENIEKLHLSQPDRVPPIISHRMLLQALLNDFDSKTLRLAEEQYGDAIFPFPEITA